jgi:hypothetical protein
MSLMVAAATVTTAIAPPGAASSGTGLPTTAKAVPRFVVKQRASARPGEYAQIEVTYENVGGPGVSTVDFGDGSPKLASEGYDQGCGVGIQPGTTGSEVLTHAYRYAGTWTLTENFAPKCADLRLPNGFRGSGTVVIQPGRAPSNGPALPLSDGLDCRTPSKSSPGEQVPARTIACFPDYADADGYVTTVALHWGDGSRDTVFTFSLARCVDPADHWPATSVDDAGPVWGTRHRYAHTGTFRATATVTSTGCDGGDRQTRSASVRVTVA